MTAHFKQHFNKSTKKVHVRIFPMPAVCDGGRGHERPDPARPLLRPPPGPTSPPARPPTGGEGPLRCRR